MLRYIIALVVLALFAADASACNRGNGRHLVRGVIATEVRIVTAPFRAVRNAAPTFSTKTTTCTTTTARGVVTPSVIVVQPAKAPCPPGGCPVPKKK